ncbi:MAG TPA: acyltransferase [Caulobacteraceae bacterium]|nr:acyltransferase [Caulobacteraceae bacterium]
MVEEVREVSQSGRFTALDSWRGICAILVTLFHFPLTGGWVHDSALVRDSYLFVDFFFVLSGYVMMSTQAGKLYRPGGGWRYLIKRLGKLWPMHVLMLAVMIGFSLLTGGLGRDERHSIPAIWTNLMLIHAYGMHGDLTWNPPSWSISVEWLLYVVFAAITPRRWSGLAYAALIVISLTVLSLIAPSGMKSTYDYGVFRGLAGFSLGVLAAKIPRRSFGTLIELAVVTAVGVFVTLGVGALAADFVFGAAVYVFAASRGALGRLLSTPIPMALGRWSYSIYMIQTAFVAFLWKIAGPMGWKEESEWLAAGPVSDLVAVFYVLGIIALASQTYYWFEEPIRRRVAAWADNLRRVAVSPQGGA